MAAYDRVDRIARAARSAGDPRTLAQLRADVFTAVLAGNPFHTVPPTDPLTRQADAEYPARPDPDETTTVRFPGPETGIRPSPTSGSRSGWPHSATPNRPTSIPGLKPGTAGAAGRAERPVRIPV